MVRDTIQIPDPEEVQDSTTEFGWDVQLNTVENAILKDACTGVFYSIVHRENNPYKRTILLGRALQAAGMMLASAALNYNIDNKVNHKTEE